MQTIVSSSEAWVELVTSQALAEETVAAPAAGILFVLFIGWIKFPHHLDNGGLVPNKGVAAPTLSQTAGALSFHWQPHVGTLVGGFITFLYLVRLLDSHCLNFAI